ncbi:Conserved_hypothetical protein [Hexamita inflata]|uniref:Uncharacterized protein n=1 Tax=Hexamita inflata TaxID=28002 RepID=A0AA86NZD7_9EUKA|nr:Conserved hypothetical protein [Hexamita inflata]
MNSQLFTNALHKYLLSKNIKIDINPLLIQQQLDSMDNNQKRGIWKQIGQILSINRTSAHNYYHNTWSNQFFDSLKSYRTYIKQIVLENPNMNNQELVQKFLDMFPNKNFSRHSLQQVVYIQKQRLGSEHTSFADSITQVDERFSVDISQCVRFLDAISM